MKRLDEILEECITAGIQGRRSVEESLALYPEAAIELEPLLRTALGFSDAFQSYNPPASSQEHGLNRLLADAAARRRLRDLATGFEDRGWFGRLWRKPVFAGFAASAAVLVLVAAITAGALSMGGGSDGTSDSSVSQPTAEPTPSLVSNLRSRVDIANEKLDTGGQLETADLQEISSIIALLNGVSIEDYRAELEATLPDTYELLTGGANGPPAGSDDPVVQDAIDTTRDLADALGLKLPEPLDGTAKTPAPTPATTQQPSAAPTSEPTAPPSGNATPAPTPTPSPTPAPTPSATADTRDPPGFLP